ncbi:hypothetical protein [Sphingobium sp. Leaf26]|uniref:hypothetical protein n=1 Tax=Sphingobium sp. Leaf26 TaxID=1735693 RepID=UPI0012E1075A|nr:hypothetical protein [Sphingobium sp. Leaf26]
MQDFDFNEAIAEVAEVERRKAVNVAPVDHGAELRRKVLEAIKRIEREYRANNPAAAKFGLSSEIHSFVKRPKNFNDYAHQMVDFFLVEPAALGWSNEKLAASVEQRTGFKTPKSLKQRIGRVGHDQASLRDRRATTGTSSIATTAIALAT